MFSSTTKLDNKYYSRYFTAVSIQSSINLGETLCRMTHGRQTDLHFGEDVFIVIITKVGGSLGAPKSGSLRAPESGSLGTPKSDIRDT